MVYAGVRGFLDNVQTSEIPKFEEKFLTFLKENHPKVIDDIHKYFSKLDLGNSPKRMMIFWKLFWNSSFLILVFNSND